LEDTKMRLPLLPPSSLSSEQKELYEDIMGVVKESFGSFIAAREDGALIGPFNAMLHFPAFGRAAWAMNKTMYERTTLPKSVLQVAVLVTGTRLGAGYQIYGHEHLAASAGVPTAKIATIVAGERPTDLTRDEAVAYDVAAALNRGGPLEDTTALPPGPTGLQPLPDMFVRLSRAPVVSIASIRGRATGVGSELALASDMRFASREKAILSQWEVGAALVPGGGPMARLPRLMGRGRALEVLLGADDIRGDLAELYG
jgi:Enoyl-CoA hydratase/isomerase